MVRPARARARRCGARVCVCARAGVSATHVRVHLPRGGGSVTLFTRDPAGRALTVDTLRAALGTALRGSLEAPTPPSRPVSAPPGPVHVTNPLAVLAAGSYGAAAAAPPPCGSERGVANPVAVALAAAAAASPGARRSGGERGARVAHLARAVPPRIVEDGVGEGGGGGGGGAGGGGGDAARGGGRGQDEWVVLVDVADRAAVGDLLREGATGAARGRPRVEARDAQGWSATRCAWPSATCGWTTGACGWTTRRSR